jgi:FMN-dependent NADH-azoreductase
MTLLRIDSSARERSVTRQLTSRFVTTWRAAHPGEPIVERDLARTVLPAITDDWLATYGDPAAMTPAERTYLSLSDTLIAELDGADIILIGAPMYNLSISAELKGWIDHVVRRGRTIVYDERGPRGLLPRKPVIVATSRGGRYIPGTPQAALDFQEPYLRAVLRVMGLDDVTFVHADNQARGPLAEPARETALALIAQLAMQFTPEGVAHVHLGSH